MEAAIVNRYLQFAHNPAYWIDESYRESIDSDAIPPNILSSAWRKPFLSAMLEKHLNLGVASKLDEDDLIGVAARLVLLETNQYQSMLIYAGICYSHESVRKIISKIAIEDAKQKLGEDPVNFARSGEATKCLGDAPDNATPPKFDITNWTRETAIATGFGLWCSAASGLQKQWIDRARYKVPAICHEMTEFKQMSELPEDYSCGVIARIIDKKASNLEWLQ